MKRVIVLSVLALSLLGIAAPASACNGTPTDPCMTSAPR
jgi:hypothetical protein